MLLFAVALRVFLVPELTHCGPLPARLPGSRAGKPKKTVLRGFEGLGMFRGLGDWV